MTVSVIGKIALDSGKVLDGEIPSLALKLLRRWMGLHREELFAAWKAVCNDREPAKIKPLRVR